MYVSSSCNTLHNGFFLCLDIQLRCYSEYKWIKEQYCVILSCILNKCHVVPLTNIKMKQISPYCIMITFSNVFVKSRCMNSPHRSLCFPFGLTEALESLLLSGSSGSCGSYGEHSSHPHVINWSCVRVCVCNDFISPVSPFKWHRMSTERSKCRNPFNRCSYSVHSISLTT